MKKAKKSRARGFLTTLVVAVFLLMIVLPLAFFVWQTKPVSNKTDEITERVEVPRGMTVRALGTELEEKKLIKSGEVFYLAARHPALGAISGVGALSLESGIYEIKSSMTLAEIFALLSSGRQAQIRVSFPEGLTLSKVASRLEEAGVCSREDFLTVAKSSALMEKYGISATTLEGYLFPDTYFFTPGMSAEDVAEMMLDNFFSHIAEIPAFSALDVSSDEFKTNLTLASIVEREYRAADEAPLIASVFKNRMKHGMGLYSCATIEYIITEIQGKQHPDVITYSDLQIDSLYNTYKWAALPPTPISNPGMTALRACAETPETNYYYFRLVDASEGRHVFSTNFETHIREGELYATKKAAF